MASVSGLSAEHRAIARHRVLQAAVLALNNRDRIWYTQGSARWQGIARKRLAKNGQYPNYCDCSSFDAWCLWNGLFVPFGVRDTVNGLNWKGGYTGTMYNHGKVIHDYDNIKVGDCAMYGSPSGKHTALCVGGGMVISMGSNVGPVKVPMRYRDDLYQVRRYI